MSYKTILVHLDTSVRAHPVSKRRCNWPGVSMPM